MIEEKCCGEGQIKDEQQSKECFIKTLGQKMGGYRNTLDTVKVDLREKRDYFFPKTRKKDRTEYPETRGKGRTWGDPRGVEVRLLSLDLSSSTYFFFFFGKWDLSSPDQD